MLRRKRNDQGGRGASQVHVRPWGTRPREVQTSEGVPDTEAAWALRGSVREGRARWGQTDATSPLAFHLTLFD
jgi:hypothetical protein